jgi:hypothetical protein
MNRLKFLVPILAGLAIAITGCQQGLTTSDAEIDAAAIAGAIADPSDGLTQEAADAGSFFFGSAHTAQPPKAMGVGVPGAYARFFSGDCANFTWNPATEAYERTRVDYLLLLPNHSVHVSSLLVQVRFYQSTDATGPSYKPADIITCLDPAVHSMKYSRTISATATNLTTGTVSDFTAVSGFTYTGIDTAAGKVTVNGTRTRTFDRTFTSGRHVAGTIEDTISGLTISWDAGTGTASWSGSLAYIYDATVARVNGTQVARHQEGTILFSGSSTFTVVVDGTSYRYWLSDGSPAD